MSQPKQQEKVAEKESKVTDDSNIAIKQMQVSIAKENTLSQSLDKALSVATSSGTVTASGEDEHDFNKLKEQVDRLKEQVDKVTRENELLNKKLAKADDEQFALTNDFTTADEGSTIKLRDMYRHMQHNLRATALRDHKKFYDKILALADHCMLAYSTAKESLFEELKKMTEKSLYQLQMSGDSPQDIKLSQNYLLLIKSLHDDYELSECIKEKIKKVLIENYKELTDQAPKDIPESIEEYYTALSKFSWDCVARPIPMIMSTAITKFDKELHETKEGGDDDDNEGKDILYVYPVLFTSSSWPREVALRGRVKFLPLTS